MTDRDIYLAALELTEAAERAAFLARVCSDNPARRQHIEGMLALAGQLGNFLETPTQALSAAAVDCLSEGPGTIIGPYKLLQVIGEGGMGTVYMAEQREPLQRKVALKIIRPGLDTMQIIARFEAERQALALMDHPNIARVLDAGEIGARGEGRGASKNHPCPSPLAPRPYFVMELVKGVPITQYCDAQRLPLASRLELFRTVCHAVQHAHQKGIIHRDLKPSNVLIAEHDNQPVAKVIDFGVAKATGPRLTERTLFTEFGQVIGTVEYMSPEQAKLNALDVDTRSDIYALGVLLYELLTGTTPLVRARARAAPFDEVLRIIREEEPPTPSNRLSTLADLPAVATNRGVDARQLGGVVRGELDWIVMKCLDKERDRRYQTAAALAQDLQHYLRDEPVAACPPSRGYRARKFIRRHKGAVMAASTIAVLLMVAVIGTTTGLVRAEGARGDAERAQRAEEHARKTAERRAAETEAALDFVESKVFAAGRPTGRGGLGRDATIRQAVANALPYVEQSFKDQPLIEARLRMTLGASFNYLSEPLRAAEQYAAARAIYRAEQGEDGVDTLASMMGLAESYDRLGRDAEAHELRQAVLARRESTLGPDDPATLRSMMAVADSFHELGRFEEAAALHDKTLTLRKAKLGLDDPQTLRSMTGLASSLYRLGRYQEALELRKETLARYRNVLGGTNLDTLLSKMALANSYYFAGQYADAAALFEETLHEQERQLGVDHQDTLRTRNNLGNCYADLGQHQKAHDFRRRTLELQQRKLPADHPDTLVSMMNLTLSLDALKRHGDAIDLGEKTLALMRTRHGDDHPDTTRMMNNLANSYGFAGRHADALKLHRETLALRQRKHGIAHESTLRSMWGLAIAHIQLDQGAEAVRLIDECLRLAEGQVLHAGQRMQMLNARLRHFEKLRDVAACRATCAMWEKLELRDANDLYCAACFRAVTARVLGPGRDADAEADQAMAWLARAVAAGFADAKLLATDDDVDGLRDRAEFKALLTQVQGRAAKPAR
jgi:serine/threonine protein kinase/tetratricopeptide (TPR) repeat protein